MVDWNVEPLSKDHERSEFSCGKTDLDRFLRTLAGQYEKRRLGRTFVAVPRSEKRVIGYYTFAAGAVSFEQLPSDASRKLPRHPVPVVHLGRLAVDVSEQGQGLGEGLLLDALARTLDLSAKLGIHAMEVIALDDAAASFYGKYGFMPLIDSPLHLYLPLATIESLLR